MKIVERCVLTLLGIAMLLALHQITASIFLTHGWEGMKPSDWAAWVQAVGAVAAIAGAVWISKREQLERRDNAAADAVLTGAIYLLPLREMHRNLQVIVGTLDIAPLAEPSPDEWLSMLGALQHRERVPAGDLLKFSALGKKCALSLARADSDLTSCEKLLSLIIAGQSAGDDYASRAKQVDLLSKIADRALNNLEHALMVISKAVDPDKVQ